MHPVILLLGKTIATCTAVDSHGYFFITVDFASPVYPETDAFSNAPVSQLLHYKAGLLQNDCVILYFQIKRN
jgi:hypothetical protein